MVTTICTDVPWHRFISTTVVLVIERFVLPEAKGPERQCYLRTDKPTSVRSALSRRDHGMYTCRSTYIQCELLTDSGECHGVATRVSRNSGSIDPGLLGL